MPNSPEPHIGAWYQRLDSSVRFTVVHIDPEEAEIEVQSLDGERDAISWAEWHDMEIEVAPRPSPDGAP